MERAEFRALFDSVCSWGRWGAGDERGALNYLTPQRVAEAAGLVSSGETVTLSLPLNTRAGPDNPAPAEHRMTMLGEAGAGPGEMGFAKDYIGVDYHNESHSHIDALCHVELDGTLYNGRPGSTITREGASTDAIAVLENGLVGRGVLLDIPRLRGVPWLEPGEHVFPEDLELCERSLGLTVAEGDILLVRESATAAGSPSTVRGRWRRRRRACIRPARAFSPSGGSRCSAPMATTTPRPVRSRESASPCMP